MVLVGAGRSLWVIEQTSVPLTGSVDGVVVHPQLPEGQLHGTLQARRRSLVCGHIT